MKGLTITNGELSIKSDGELIQSRLERLFFCGLNSSVGLLQKGSRIPEILHTLATGQAPKQAITEIALLIQMYESLIILKSVSVTMWDNPTGETDMEIDVEFTWTNTDASGSVSLSYPPKQVQ